MITNKLYRLWLSIIVTNPINLSMIFSSIRSALIRKSELSQSRLRYQTKTSQLQKIREKHTIKIAIIGSKAYWVYDNTFYETSVVNGMIDNQGAKPVDTSRLSNKEVRMLMDVLDNIS